MTLGQNHTGQLGQNNTTRYSSPTQIPGTTWAAATPIAGAYVGAATRTDGTLWVWGVNEYGKLGLNKTTE